MRGKGPTGEMRRSGSIMYLSGYLLRMGLAE